MGPSANSSRWSIWNLASIAALMRSLIFQVKVMPEVLSPLDNRPWVSGQNSSGNIICQNQQVNATEKRVNIMTMSELRDLDLTLISEAHTILYDYRLLEILKKYGNPIVHGSYSLNLMAWRDLDIYLENDELDAKDFFNLGMDIATELKPRRMSYRNEYIGKTPNLPKGLYWGVYTTLEFPDEWKIDIWAMDSDQIRSQCRRLQDLKPRITEKNRLIILMIKSHFCKHSEYRKRFSSADIYKSVIEENIESVQEFSRWLKENKGIE